MLELGALGVGEARIGRERRALRLPRARNRIVGRRRGRRIVVEIEIGSLRRERGAIGETLGGIGLRDARERDGILGAARETAAAEIGGAAEGRALTDEDPQAEALLARVGELLDLAETYGGRKRRLLH